MMVNEEGLHLGGAGDFERAIDGRGAMQPLC